MPALKGNHIFETLIAKKPAFVLVPAWLLMHLMLFKWYGIRVVYDSHRYLAYADSLASGTTYWLNPDNIFYASYTVFLAFFLHLLQLPIGAVIVTQLIMAALGAFYLYKATCNLTHSRTTAFICLLLFILWPDLHSWNLYIHTESLYISLTIIVFYLVSKKEKMINDQIALILLLTVVFFLRPNGFILHLAVLTALVFGNQQVFKPNKTGWIICAIVFIPLGFYSIKVAFEVFSPLNYLLKGQVIQGYNGLVVHFKPVKTASSVSIIEQMFHTIVAQPASYIKLIFLRFTFFWAHVRPYYSIAHNAIICLFFAPVYFTAILGLKQVAPYNKSYIFMLVVTVLQTAMAMVIAVDWDNRFVVPLLPFVFILSSIGVTSFTRQANAPHIS